jgi:hypothetical protein
VIIIESHPAGGFFIWRRLTVLNRLTPAVFVNLRTGNTVLLRYFCVCFPQSREDATWRRCGFARNFAGK